MVVNISSVIALLGADDVRGSGGGGAVQSAIYMGPFADNNDNNIQVRRAGLTEKTLDELEVARDITVRKRVSKM